MSSDSQPCDNVTLDQRNLDAAIATAIFFQESKLQHKDKILPLLLSLLKCLPHAKWNESREFKRKLKGCLAEEFAFHFVLLLLEIGSLQKENANLSNDFISSIVEVFEVLVKQCCTVGTQSNSKKGNVIGKLQLELV